MQWGILPVEDIEVGLPKILDGIVDDEYPRATEVLEYGLYGRHLSNYFRDFQRGQLLTIFDSDLRDDLRASTSKLCNFLGIESEVQLAGLGTVNAGNYSLRRLRFLQRRNKYLLQSYPGFPGRYMERPGNMRELAYVQTVKAIDKWGLARAWPASAPHLSSVLRERLVDYYSRDAEQMMQLLELPNKPWSWM